jgi:hypothetical protein
MCVFTQVVVTKHGWPDEANELSLNQVSTVKVSRFVQFVLETASLLSAKANVPPFAWLYVGEFDKVNVRPPAVSVQVAPEPG